MTNMDKFSTIGPNSIEKGKGLNTEVTMKRFKVPNVYGIEPFPTSTTTSAINTSRIFTHHRGSSVFE